MSGVNKINTGGQHQKQTTYATIGGTSVRFNAVDVDVFWAFQVEFLERCPLDLTGATGDIGVFDNIRAADLTTDSQSNVAARISISRDRRSNDICHYWWN